MLHLRAMDVTDAALRFTARRSAADWMVLVVDIAADVQTMADEFADAMETAGGVCARQIRGAQDAASLASELQSITGPLIISGLDGWDSSEWAHLDHLRSRFSRKERTALVLGAKAFERIMQEAPNFSSWLGANVVKCENTLPILTEEERWRRLSALQEWSGLSNDEVIQRAQEGKLPAEPEYAEWLVLLERGDLLHG